MFGKTVDDEIIRYYEYNNVKKFVFSRPFHRQGMSENFLYGYTGTKLEPSTANWLLFMLFASIRKYLELSIVYFISNVISLVNYNFIKIFSRLFIRLWWQTIVRLGKWLPQPMDACITRNADLPPPLLLPRSSSSHTPTVTQNLNKRYIVVFQKIQLRIPRMTWPGPTNLRRAGWKGPNWRPATRFPVRAYIISYTF